MRQLIIAVLCIAPLAAFIAYGQSVGEEQDIPSSKLVTAQQSDTVVQQQVIAETITQTTASPATEQPHIQVVFALDATGSMEGLISAAKEKIWSIAGSLSQTEETPKIEMGLIFYRDRGDDFITQKVAMQQDLDAMYEKLMDIQASGGGDEPESVNQALHEAIKDFAWSNNSNTYKTVFLVGDCPPHMDYKEVKYPASCSLANQKGIVVNTILMGSNADAEEIWRSISDRTKGSFTKVDMNVNNITVNTPYDEQISKLSDQIDEMRYTYGNQAQREMYEAKKDKSRKIAAGASASTKAQRAEYNNVAAGKTAYYGNKELLDDIAYKRVKVSDIKKEELPETFKNMNESELQAAINTQIAQRDALSAQITNLSKKRQEYIDAELLKRKDEEVKTSFNYQIYDKVKEQAAKKNIKLKDKVKF